MRLLLLTLALFLSLGTGVRAQSEIRWTVNLNTDQITQTEKAVFQALEKDLVTFLNSQTWTDERFSEDERIEATIFLTVKEVFGESKSEAGAQSVVPNQYEATLALQSLRPIYGTNEVTPVLNTQDKNVAFSYRQGEGVQYSEQSYLSDLGSIMAFYSYIVLGLDFDTFAPLGGQPYFEAARELYNRLPDNIANSRGWTAGGKTRNRFALMENILEPRMLPLRRGYYTYHRLGLDMMTTDIVSARTNITLAIEDAQKANANYPSTVYAQAFVDSKREEIIEIYKGASGVEQNTVIQNMGLLDPSQRAKYREIRFRGPARRSSPGRAPVSRSRRSR